MKKVTIATHCVGLAISAVLASSGTMAVTNTLEEVLVTAQKRSQSLQDVPIAISALDAQAMANAGVQSINDVSRLVPALEVQSSVDPVSTNYRIRRVGNLGNIPTFEPAVGVFIDGAFRLRSVFAATDLFDLERIEILRGPQSTLYGKNSTAGVIAIYTAAPTEEFTGSGELSAGNMDGANKAFLVNFKGGVSGPLAQDLRGSLGVSYNMHDKTMNQALSNSGEDTNETDRYSIRGQLAWDATDALSFRLIAGTMQQDDNKQQSPDLYFDPNGILATQILPLWQAAGVSETCSDNDPKNRTSCLIRTGTVDLSAEEATLLAVYSFSNGITLNSITSWDYFDYHGTQGDGAQMMGPLARIVDKQENESLQQELRLTSPGDETLDWMAGVFVYTNENKRGDDGKAATFIADTEAANPAVIAGNLIAIGVPVPIGTPGQLGFLSAKQTTDYIGVYGQTAWNITEDFTITTGVRWQQEEKDADIYQWSNDPTFSVISFLLSPEEISGGGLNRDTDEITWSVSPQWHVTDSTMLFATGAHGFKSGGYNTGFGRLPIDQREFDDEKVMHYEAGIKSELWDGRMRLSASTFYTEYDDYQDAAFIGAQFTVGNAEKAELKGFELEGQVLLSDEWTADFAISYADFIYQKNTSGVCYPGKTPDSPTNPSACDLSGDHPINAPEWKTHLGIMYEKPVNWGSFYGRVDWSWTDDYNTSFTADPRLVQDAYNWLNVRAGARRGDYEVIAWVDNLTNETVTNFDAPVNFYAIDGSYQSFLQAPRSYGLTVRASF